jgi:hypothetical protein
MTGFDLPYNFNPNPERIGCVVRCRVVPPQKRLSLGQGSITLASSPMPQKTLRQFLASSSSHIPIGLNTDKGNEGFELKTGLVNMVQASPFCGKASEDANAHLQNFLEVSRTINPRGTTMEKTRLRLFPFSLLGKQRRGSTPTRMHSPHGMLALMHSWPSTFRWARPTPFGTGFSIFNNSRMKPS